MIKKLFNSLIFRLTFLFLIASIFSLGFVGFCIDRSIYQYALSQDSVELNEKMADVKKRLAIINTDNHINEQSQIKLDLTNLGRLEQYHRILFFVFNEQKELIYSNSAHHILSSIPTSLLNNSVDNDIAMWIYEQTYYRGLSSDLFFTQNQSRVQIIIAKDITQYQHFLTSCNRSMWISILIAIFIMGACGWIVAKNGLKPLKNMVDSTAGIDINQLNKRLSTDHTPTELRVLTKTLNSMFERLERSFSRLSGFSSDLAHELRTPVNTLKMQTQVTLSKPRTNEEYRDVLCSNAEEYDHLTQMIADLLFLAKTDNGVNVPNRVQLDLRHEVQKVVDFYLLFAEDKGITLTIIGQAEIAGDELMLRRALSNLIMNAITYSYENTEIKITIAQDAEDITIEIENRGATIAAEHIPYLFNRFYRINDSREVESDGVGLGLAITESIIRAHCGSISVVSENEITRFTVKLPIYCG